MSKKKSRNLSLVLENYRRERRTLEGKLNGANAAFLPRTKAERCVERLRVLDDIIPVIEREVAEHQARLAGQPVIHPPHGVFPE